MIAKSIVGSKEDVKSPTINERRARRTLLYQILAISAFALIVYDFNSEKITGACSTLNRSPDCISELWEKRFPQPF